MRMKFLRIRPETCARAWCLFSSSTLNIAFGSVSTTTAITSIASSFDKRSPLRDLGGLPPIPLCRSVDTEHCALHTQQLLVYPRIRYSAIPIHHFDGIT